MPRRKRYAEEWELRPEEPPPERVVARAPAAGPAREDEEREERSPREQTMLRLQRSVGNTALTKMLIQHYGLPPALDEAEALALDAPDGTPRASGVEELAGKEPREHLTAFTALGEQMQPEARELVRRAVETSSGSLPGLTADRLKTLARARLVAPTEPTKVTDVPALVDRLCDELATAWAQWQRASILTGVIVNSATATGGQMVGPPLQGLIEASTSTSSSEEQAAARALSTVVGDAHMRWQLTIKVPGLPWYPAFAAFPGPFAPPSPNVPSPLSALVFDPSAFHRLEQRLHPQDAGAAAAARAVAGALGGAFPEWISRTMVVNVLGTGPVPMFAPPFVPAGPVVGGIANSPPGVFVTSR